VKALVEDFTPLAATAVLPRNQAIIGGLGRISNRPASSSARNAATTPKAASGTISAWQSRRLSQGAAPHAPRRPFRPADCDFCRYRRGFPGVDAEARGQAKPSRDRLKSAFQSACQLSRFIIGEGGSGGAIAIATGDRVMMLEHAIYSVIFAGRLRIGSYGAAQRMRPMPLQPCASRRRTC